MKTMKTKSSFLRKVCALAFASLMTQVVWAAATPIVFWNGDFETTSKTVGNETYTLNLNGNTVATDGSYVEITDTERKGVEVSWSTPLVDCTILMQYEGLTQTAKTYPIALLGLSTASYANVDGLAINGSDRVVKAYWANNYYYSGGDKTITMDGDFGIISLRYSSSGTFARVKEGDSSWAELYGNSSIKGNGTYAMTRAFFGGSNAFVKSDGTSSMSVPTGMKIKAIAIFPANTALTDCDEYVFPVVEKKDYSRWASAPAIFSYVSGENVHNANYQLLDAATGKCGSTFGGATANTNIPRQGGNSITPWNVFVEKSGYKYVAPGYVLHFGPDATRHNTIDASFEPFNIGGLIVETGATGYGLTGTGARSTTFGDTRTSNGVETWQYIGEDFTINRQGAVTLKGTINIEVAQDKVYDLNSTQTTHNLVLDTATHAALKFHGKGNIKVNTLTATGAVTLDFSDLEVANAPFITGNLTIDASTKIVFPANLAENTAYQVCSGTLTAPEAATSRQIVQIGEDAVYAKIVYDAANKSIKYVSAEDDDFVFTGATDNNWSTAANWNKGAVPTTGATAIIPAGKKAQFTATTSLGNGVIVVQKGGTVDVNGKIGLNNYVISGDGEGNGALINTSTAAINFNQGGITSLKLCGDASIGGAGWWGMKNGGQAIDLGIYTLTVKVRNGNYGFVSSPVAISGTGTIKVAPSGTFWLYAGADTNEPITLMDGTLNVAAGGVLSPERAPLTVKNLVMNGSVIQNKSVTVNGTLSGTGTIKNTTLASGATIDVSEGVLTLSGTLTVGENLTVKVAEPVESGVPVAVMNLSGSAFGAGSDVAKVSVVVDDSQQDGAFYLSVNADATKLVVRKLGEGDSLMTEIKGSTILAPLVISGYTHAITGFGGAEIQSLSLVGETARLVIDPPRTPAKINSKPVFDGGKIRLAPVYDDVACGKYVLLTWNGATLGLDADGLKGLVDIVCGKDYTVEEVMNGSLRQLVLKVGDYDNEAKQIIWEPMGDSITEGIIKDNAKGTPNYRIPTAQRLEAIGYKVVTRGFRQIGCTDANGVAAAEAHGYHDGISAERVWTGLRSGVKRAGFIEALEAHLESAGIPDVITLKIGTNDIIGNDNPQHVFEGWTNIVNRIIANRPTTKIIVTTIIDVSGTTNDDAYNTLIKDYCAKSEAEGGFPAGHVFLIDQNPVVLRNSSPAMYLSDAVHPTWYGHQKMADCWFDGFKTALAAADIGTYEPVGTKYGAENTVPAEYSEGFKKIAEFDKITGKMTDWNGEVYSSVNEALAAKKLKRIAYYVERKTVNSPDNRFVWVDMDTWQDEATLANSGIPTDETTRANKVVNNLHIYSNSTGIQNVEPNVSGVRGTLLFTNKSLTDATGITDAPASQYELDWNNTLNDNSDLGAMIVSRLFEGASLNDNNNLLAPAEVLFSFNGFAKAGRKNVFGIGSFPIHSKYNVGNSALSKLTMNWVCNLDDEVYPLTAADQLTSGKIEIWGVPETVTIEIPAAPTGAEVEVTVDGEVVEIVDGSIEAAPGAEIEVAYFAARDYNMDDVVFTFVAGEESTIDISQVVPVAKVYVAQIGSDGKKYEKLQAAIDAANNDDVVYLIANTTESILNNKKDLTLHINEGVTLTGTVYYYTIFNGGHTLTIEGEGTIKAGGTKPAGQLYIALYNSGTMYVKGCTIESANHVIYENAADKTVVTGGKFTKTPAPWLGRGCIATQTADKKYYTVEQLSYIAKIGATEYDSLQAAIDAVQEGQMIDLVCATDETINFNKDFVVAIKNNGNNYGTITGAMGVWERWTAQYSNVANYVVVSKSMEDLVEHVTDNLAKYSGIHGRFYIYDDWKLTKDVTIPTVNDLSQSIFTIKDTFTLDLNGFALEQAAVVNSHGGYPTIVANYGKKVTIKDSSEAQTGILCGIGWAVDIYDDPKTCVTLESGTITTHGAVNKNASDMRGRVIRIMGGKFVMNGGKITLDHLISGNTIFGVITASTAVASTPQIELNGGYVECAKPEQLWNEDGSNPNCLIGGSKGSDSEVEITGGSFSIVPPKTYFAEGLDAVVDENGHFHIQQVVHEGEEVSIAVSDDGEKLAPTVPEEGSVEIIAPDETKVYVIDIANQEAPAALYQVVTKDADGGVVSTSKIGVIKVEEKATEKKTIAVAVPFTGATVENLLNTKLLNEGDELKAYVDGAYSMWSLDASGKWVSKQTVRAGGTETAPNAETTPLKRGTAVWVTTAGQVVTLGTFDKDTEIATADESVNLLANPTMEAFEPAITAETVIGDQVIETGVDHVRYTVVEQGGAKTWRCSTTIRNSVDGEVIDSEKIETKAPSIRVGRGYWMMKKPENK